MRFRAKILLAGKTATGFRVPEEIMTSLGPSKKPAVLVTIDGHTYRSTVASMSGEYRIPISAENRASAGVSAGDEVDVDVQLDTAPREVTVPADLADELALHSEAKRFFDGMSYSHKRWYVEWIESAKRAETRLQRITKAIGMLEEGKTP